MDEWRVETNGKWPSDKLPNFSTFLCFDEKQNKIVENDISNFAFDGFRAVIMCALALT